MTFKQWKVGVGIVMKNTISCEKVSLQPKVMNIYVILNLRVHYKKINRLLNESISISIFN